MSKKTSTRSFHDALYGKISFDAEISALIDTPVVQRLRHIRLSNIDSLDMPGISNISRFEHILGVAHLASIVGFRPSLNYFDDLVLMASSLLHDWAITSFGHLIEESLQYVGAAFEHETKLSDLIGSEDSEEIGGIDFQILLGRQTGLSSWTKKFAKQKRKDLIEEITKHIYGRGQMGGVISGDIDLDNIDNVYRMAFHMGLLIDKNVPIRLAQSIVGFKDGETIFRDSSKNDIKAWLSTRQTVYQHLMLAENDFIGKVMLLYASVLAYERGEILKADWTFTDNDLLNALLKSPTKEVRETTERWISGELWSCTPLYWMSEERPDYPRLLEFSKMLTVRLQRQCFAYGIKDKRERHLEITFDNGQRQAFGTKSRQWLLGVGSPKRAFTLVEIDNVIKLAQSFFNISVIAPASIGNADEDFSILSVLNVNRLNQVDWDFPKAGTDSGTVNSIHCIPGNFIPQIPAALIQVLSKPGQIVLDPFGGSGTTAIEGLKLGRNVILSDIITACVKISDAKISTFNTTFSQKECSKILGELIFENLCRTDRVGKRGEGSNQELRFWYEPDTLAQLRYIWSVVESQETLMRKLLFVVFSNLLFACASTNGALTSTGKTRRHHWGWVADNVRPKELVHHNAIELFRQKLLTIVDDLCVPPVVNSRGTVMQQDARSMGLAAESIDLVVTSPPYIGVIDYTHANRLLYLWMGWSMGIDRINEIGARYRRFRKHAIEEYKSEIRLCRNEIYRVLRKGSFCAIIIGESKKFPGTAKWVIDDFSELMPVVWGPKPRYLSRRRVSDRLTSAPVEHICVFQK